ncbi:AAA family ATPase [Halomicronema hongdechloris]|uniref:AAA family ATPase n=1 Tax=Halomicronema hongdechloris TaxID=1209493 RepID=UPI0016518584|nr:AAA family ATPase [Halomicronema hongdechloris]
MAYANELVTSVQTPRLQSLLAHLVLHRHAPQSRQHLAVCIWPDSTDSQARTNLRRELYHLRQALPDAKKFLDIRPNTLQWRPADSPFHLDAADFEAAVALAQQTQDVVIRQTALEKAISLYQGDLLPSCYDDWIIPERNQLRQTYVHALDTMIEYLQEQREYGAAIAYAHRRLTHDPLCEAAYRRLMQLHGLNGDRASALQVYHRCVEVLEAKLGVEPSPATCEVVERLQTWESKAKDQNLDNSKFKIQNSKSFHPPLIGRETECRTLRHWLTTENTEQLLLLTGEPGIGKTRLLDELRASVLAARGQVLQGRGFEAEMVRPYGAWIDALRSGPQATHRAAQAEAGDGLSVALDRLLSTAGNEPEALSDRAQLFDAVVERLLRLAADCGLTVVILDDLQWLDETSIALLHYASRLLRGSLVRFACATRPRALAQNAPAAGFIQALQRERCLQSIDLAPLNRAHTSELARTFHSPVDEERLFLDSGGNPLFALEIARSAHSDSAAGPGNLEVLIQARLQQLEPAARELLPWAAALGRSFRLTTLAQVADNSPMGLLAALEQLEQYGIIRPGTDSDPDFEDDIEYDFAHDMVRQVAYQRLSQPRRRWVHLQLAQALEHLSGKTDTLAGEIAHHAALGGNRTLAAATALRAAQRCLRLFAYAEASKLAQRGIQHCQKLKDEQRVALHLELLGVYVLAGVSRAQVPTLEQELQGLIAEAKTLKLKDTAAIGLEALIALSYDHGDLTGVHQHSLQAAETGRSTSPAMTARTLANSGSCLADIGRDMPQAEALLLEAQSLAARVGIELSDIPHGLGCVRRFAGDWAEARQLLATGWQQARREQDHWRESVCLLNLALVEFEAGTPGAALPYCQEMAIVADKIGGEGSEAAFAEGLSALAQYQLGHTDAAARLESALTTLRQIDAKRMLAFVLTAAAESDLQREHPETAIPRAEEALQVAQIVDYPSSIALAWAVLIRATVGIEPDSAKSPAEQLQALHRALDGSPLSARARRAVDSLNPMLAIEV